MKKQIIAALLCGALAASLLPGCSSVHAHDEVPVKTAETEIAETAAILVPETGETVIAFTDDGASIDGAGAEADGGEVKIRASGVYHVTGTSDAARLVVDAADTDEVTLILDGCDLACADDEVIYIKTAGSAVVVIADGTENTLTSGETPEGSALGDADEDASGAALRFKCPLTVTGSGKLTVNGYINNGIGGNEDLTLDGGVVYVTAVNDGVKSKADVTVSSGVLAVVSSMDGIQADGALTILGGTLDITTGAGAAGADMKVSDSSMMGTFGGGRGRASGEADAEGTQAEAGSGSREMGFGMPWDQDDESSASRKGLKSGEGIFIHGGSVVLDAEDDAIHSDADVLISGGELQISSGDDGIHADDTLTITGGTVEVQYCYEGFEGYSIQIEDGTVKIAATDDGMNVNGGSDMFGFFRASGEASGETEGTEDASASDEADETESAAAELRIAGGYVFVDSGGDGLDSNGSIYIEGGEVYVSGPSSNWDAAIDYGEGSAEFIITGGTVMAGGYSGMAEAPDAAEGAQCAIFYAFSDYAEDGALCTLKDADGNTLAEFNLVHSGNCVVVSTPELAVGRTYTLTLGDQEAVIEMTSVVFSNRTRGGMGPGSREASAEAGA